MVKRKNDSIIKMLPKEVGKKTKKILLTKIVTLSIKKPKKSNHIQSQDKNLMYMFYLVFM